MNIEMCVNCQNNVNYKIVDVDYEYSDEEISLNYKGKKALCENCGEEILIDEIEDFNQTQFEEEYKRINEIITKEEINEILGKYDIGKRPLSLLLNFGEITLTRYLSNYVPTKKNSLLLKKILRNPEFYYSILMSNKKSISTIAFNKSLKAVSKFIDENCFEDNNISLVTNYIISKIDVTPKALQKILYYIQLFSFKFMGYPAFTSGCKRWSHGPVVGKIYFQFKDYGFKVIEPQISPELEIDKDLLEISNAVIKYFGCYSADVLEEFTHNEKPWKETKENDFIEKEVMKNYVFEICKDNQIDKISDIEKYSRKKFEEFLNAR